MRTESFKREIRKIRENFHHAFHDRIHWKATETAWRRVTVAREFSPRLTILDTMQEHPIAVRPDSPLIGALTLMIENEISGLPVIDAEDRIVGVLSESDLLKVFYEPDATNVASVMTRDPAVVSVHAPLVELIDQLMASDFRRVLVHQDGKLVGIVTRAHLMPALLEGLEEESQRRGAWTHAADTSVSH
jgi:CBS domain-containing protein